MSAIQPALITKVLPDSIASEVGFEAGDAIISINGTRPRDLIDYRFLCTDEVLELEVLDAQGQTHHVEIEKDYDDDLGLEFATALFDGLRQCNNHCPFCFIDQQPPGKRSSLYLKDDDYRLSFLYGSYLTLTNLLPSDWERISQMRLSPLYVSVHATEPQVRSRLLKNPRAGQILEQLAWFEARQLQIHAQVVVCPGINDGPQLDRTIQDLGKFPQAIASVAIVPLGLTKFRPQADELTPVTPELAALVIQQVQRWQEHLRQTLGQTLVWLADEWFLIAGQDLPPESDYEGYPQLGNGVGSIRQFLKEFTQKSKKLLPKQVMPKRQLTWVVGNAVAKAFQPLAAQLNSVDGLTVQLVSLSSDYWGQEITATGLLTGSDLCQKLAGRDLGSGILLPTVMLKHGEECFLDDMTIAQVSQTLGVPIFPVDGVEELISQCLVGRPR